MIDEDANFDRELNCSGLLFICEFPAQFAGSGSDKTHEPKATQTVAFHDVLCADLSDFDITIRYAVQTSKDVLRVAVMNYEFEDGNRTRANAWTAKLLDQAYGSSKRNKRIKVLINPHGGVGSASKLFYRDMEPIFAAARCSMDVEETRYSGHAVSIAEQIDVDAFDVIACCSGDGVPHEVFNGFGHRPDAGEALSKVAVVQLPCGSGNGMSWSLNGTASPSVSALCTVKGLRTPLDLASVTQADRRTLSFLSQAFGIVAESDLGTEHLRWMGSARFIYGFLTRLLFKVQYPCDLALKVEIGDRPGIKAHYQKELHNKASETSRRSACSQTKGLPPLCYGTVNENLPSEWELVPYDNLGSFYAGNMTYMTANAPVFPAALPNDGFFDLVSINGDMSRTSVLRSLLAIQRGAIFDVPCVNMRKISGYRLIPRKEKDGYISVDGEKLPFQPFQVEVHRGLGTVLSKSGHLYEAKGVT